MNLVAAKAPKPNASDGLNLEHHKRVCYVCKHPALNKIESMFCQFVKIRDIVRTINSMFPDRKISESGLSKHIYAFDLAHKRTEDATNIIRYAAEVNVDKLSQLSPTDSLKAAELYGKTQGIFIDRQQIENIQHLDTGELRSLLVDELKHCGIEADYEVVEEDGRSDEASKDVADEAAAHQDSNKTAAEKRNGTGEGDG